MVGECAHLSNSLNHRQRFTIMIAPSTPEAPQSINLLAVRASAEWRPMLAPLKREPWVAHHINTNRRLSKMGLKR